jgi:hypothetical protein
MHAACDRAREWATADVDGELSSFERVLLNAHLAECPTCREFQVAVNGFTVVGLGSILASSDLRSPSSRISAPSEFSGLDTMNLATAQARASKVVSTGPVRTLQARSSRSLRGGPVIRNR